MVKLSSIGDVVHALPVAVALKRAPITARVTWIAEAREAVMLAGHPSVDDVIVADTRGWRRNRPGLPAAREALDVARRLRREAFDVALDLQGLMKSAMLTALTRAPRRIGFAAGWSREWPSTLLINERVRPPAAARHVVDQYLALARPLGIETTPVEFRIPADPAADARVDEFLAGVGIKPHDRLVLVNPGAGRPEKRWPVERFRDLGRRLTDEAGARVVALWGPGEEDDARAIVTAGALLAPPTTLRDLTALVRRARLVIAADTGPLHIAAAVGTPCLGLYGPTSGIRNGPYGAGNRVLQGPDGQMASITVPAALTLATSLLEAGA